MSQRWQANGFWFLRRNWGIRLGALMRRRGSLGWSWRLLRTGVISWMILGGIGRLRCILNRRRLRLTPCWKRRVPANALTGFWRLVIGRRLRRLMWRGDWGWRTTIRRRWKLAAANCGGAEGFGMRGGRGRGFARGGLSRRRRPRYP